MNEYEKFCIRVTFILIVIMSFVNALNFIEIRNNFKHINQQLQQLHEQQQQQNTK